MKYIGGMRPQDVDIIEGYSTTLLTLVETIRQLQHQLEAVDKALCLAGKSTRGTGIGRIQAIEQLANKEKDDRPYGGRAGIRKRLEED